MDDVVLRLTKPEAATLGEALEIEAEAAQETLDKYLHESGPDFGDSLDEMAASFEAQIELVEDQRERVAHLKTIQDKLNGEVNK